MTKRELVIDVAERLGFTQNEVSDVVQATLDEITDSLSEGNRLEIRNFGVFDLKKRDARMGRNPRTGDAVPIEEKKVAVFKPGKALRELVERKTPVVAQTTAPNLNLPSASSPTTTPSDSTNTLS